MPCVNSHFRPLSEGCVRLVNSLVMYTPGACEYNSERDIAASHTSANSSPVAQVGMVAVRVNDRLLVYRRSGTASENNRLGVTLPQSEARARENTHRRR